MVFAALYFFGLKSGVGANTLSLFFKMIRIDTHVGISVSTLRTQLNQMETLLPIFQDLCEKQVKKQPHKIIAGLDETFFGEFIILVLMDLRSGYLLLEEVSDDRCFDTWYEKTTPRLESLGLEVNHKFRRINAEKALEKAQQTQANYHENLQGISEEVHPFSLNDNSINDAEKIEERLENRAQIFERIAESKGIKDSGNVMRKFRNQFQPLAISVTFWWLLVTVWALL
jgi:AraC-like DNA-binding protein